MSKSYICTYPECRMKFKIIAEGRSKIKSCPYCGSPIVECNKDNNIKPSGEILGDKFTEKEKKEILKSWKKSLKSIQEAEIEEL